jgi:hypothetical protein
MPNWGSQNAFQTIDRIGAWLAQTFVGFYFYLMAMGVVSHGVKYIDTKLLHIKKTTGCHSKESHLNSSYRWCRLSVFGQVEGRAEMSSQTAGYKFQDQKDVKGGKVELRSETDGIAAVINVVGDGAMDLGGTLYEKFKNEDSETPVQSFTPTQKRTMFVKHGAGGTSAITWDVQTAMTEAYKSSMKQIERELGGDQSNLGPNSILDQIVKEPMNPERTLHPMTTIVINRALEELARSGGSQYQALTGGSGMFGRSSVLKAAQRKVMKGYGILVGDPFKSVDVVLKEVQS